MNSTVSASAKNAGPLFQLFGMRPRRRPSWARSICRAWRRAARIPWITTSSTSTGIGGKGNFQGQVVSLCRLRGNDHPEIRRRTARAAACAAGLQRAGRRQARRQEFGRQGEYRPRCHQLRPHPRPCPAWGARAPSRARSPAFLEDAAGGDESEAGCGQPGPLLSLALRHRCHRRQARRALGVSGRLDGGVNAMKLPTPASRPSEARRRCRARSPPPRHRSPST